MDSSDRSEGPKSPDAKSPDPKSSEPKPTPANPVTAEGLGKPVAKGGGWGLRERQAVYLRHLKNQRWGKTMMISLAAAIGVGLIIGDALLPDCEHEGCPAVERLRTYRPPEPAKIMDSSGELAGQLHGPRRTVVGLDSIPELVREGYIAVEDRRFRDHGGVDFTGAARAFFRNLGSGGVEEGASTITMQLARNVFGEEVLDYNRWHRKASEIRTSHEIEDQLTKDQILELYLNQIYLGDGVWGVETAARHYFGKSVTEVNENEAAVLIGLAKNPEGYNPNRNPERARERRDLVLDILAGEGLMTAAEASTIKAMDIEVVEDPEQISEWGTNAYYMGAVWRELRELMPNPVDRQGMRVFTGLDQRAQSAAAVALVAEIRAIESGKLGRFRGTAAPAELERAKGDSPYLQGMVVAMDAQTGLVTTLVGGRDYDHSEFDRAFQAKRQPGSAFKPIVYLTALASGLRPSEVIPTDPIRLAQRGSDDWMPDDHVSSARLTVRDALVFSSNAASVRVGQRAGIDRVVDQAHSMGITTDLTRYPSIFLGAGEVIPAELVAAYATFGNGGHTIAPHLITKIEDAHGNVVYERLPQASAVAVDERLGFLVLDMMRDVVRRGTGTRASLPGIPVAGKTGTTNDSKDLWFIGLTPKRVAGVWIGFDQPRTVIADMGGGDAAAPVWARFMTVAVRNDKGTGAWSMPRGVVQASVDSETGYRWGPGCVGQARNEYFLAGTEPVAECPDWGTGWFMNALGQWEYRGSPSDSLGYSSYSYGSDTLRYGRYQTTYGDSARTQGRTIFWQDTAVDGAEFERRRRAQLDSLDRAWEQRRTSPAPVVEPSRTDTDRPFDAAPDTFRRAPRMRVEPTDTVRIRSQPTGTPPAPTPAPRASTPTPTVEPTPEPRPALPDTIR
jgi:penicillin-binding protein 1A